MKAGKIEWKRYVDHVFCIHYAPYEERLSRLKRELKRVDLLGSGIFEIWPTFPSAWDKRLTELSNFKMTPGAVNLSLATIRMLEEAKLRGYGRIMVIEDDVAFLREKTDITSILEAMPSGFGYVQLEKLCHTPSAKKDSDKDRDESPINDFFFRGRTICLMGSGSYILTGNGITSLLEVLNSLMVPVDVAKAYLKCGVAVSVRNMTVQMPYKTSLSETDGIGGEDIRRFYELAGCRMEDYNVPKKK